MADMGGFIGLVIVLAFVVFVGSKIYNHEKEHIDPLIKKVKSWFIKDDEGDGDMGPDEDFELSFRGQVPN